MLGQISLVLETIIFFAFYFVVCASSFTTCMLTLFGIFFV